MIKIFIIFFCFQNFLISFVLNFEIFHLGNSILYLNLDSFHFMLTNFSLQKFKSMDKNIINVDVDGSVI